MLEERSRGSPELRPRSERRAHHRGDLWRSKKSTSDGCHAKPRGAEGASQAPLEIGAATSKARGTAAAAAYLEGRAETKEADGP